MILTTPNGSSAGNAVDASGIILTAALTLIATLAVGVVVALITARLATTSERAKWLREERMKIYAEYVKSSELYRLASGEPLDGLNTMMAEVDNRSKLDILGPKNVREAATRVRASLEPVRLRDTFTEAEYGEYLDSKTYFVTACLKALGIKDSDPTPFSAALKSDWWTREYDHGGADA